MAQKFTYGLRIINYIVQIKFVQSNEKVIFFTKITEIPPIAPLNKTKYMVTDRYSLYNGNGQLMTNEGNF